MFEVIAISLALGAPSPSPSPGPGPAGSGVVTVPASIDLGVVAPGTTVEQSVWLVNTSWQTATVIATKPNCECTTVPGFEPVTLAPGAAHPVSFSVKAPKKNGATKTVRLAFVPAWGEPIELSTVIATTSETAIATETAPTVTEELLLLTQAPHLGTVTSGTPFDTSAWIINRGDRVERIDGIKAGCGCTKVLGFEPTTLAPGAAQRVRLRITPSMKGAPAKTVAITAHINGRAPLTTTLQMRVEPAVAAHTDR